MELIYERKAQDLCQRIPKKFYMENIIHLFGMRFLGIYCLLLFMSFSIILQVKKFKVSFNGDLALLSFSSFPKNTSIFSPKKIIKILVYVHFKSYDK
jgi:hypothetical protein